MRTEKVIHKGHSIEFRAVSKHSSLETARHYHKSDDYQAVLKILGPEIQVVIESNTCFFEEAIKYHLYGLSKN